MYGIYCINLKSKEPAICFHELESSNGAWPSLQTPAASFSPSIGKAGSEATPTERGREDALCISVLDITLL